MPSNRPRSAGRSRERRSFEHNQSHDVQVMDYLNRLAALLRSPSNPAIEPGSDVLKVDVGVGERAGIAQYGIARRLTDETWAAPARVPVVVAQMMEAGV